MSRKQKHVKETHGYALDKSVFLLCPRLTEYARLG